LCEVLACYFRFLVPLGVLRYAWSKFMSECDWAMPVSVLSMNARQASVQARRGRVSSYCQLAWARSTYLSMAWH